MSTSIARRPDVSRPCPENRGCDGGVQARWGLCGGVMTITQGFCWRYFPPLGGGMGDAFQLNPNYLNWGGVMKTGGVQGLVHPPGCKSLANVPWHCALLG